MVGKHLLCCGKGGGGMPLRVGYGGGSIDGERQKESREVRSMSRLS